MTTNKNDITIGQYFFPPIILYTVNATVDHFTLDQYLKLLEILTTVINPFFFYKIDNPF
jgi:hypothetical protein